MNADDIMFVRADLLADARKEISVLREQVKVLREALEDIEDYWNQDNNETAMSDACWHAIEIAGIALEQIKPKDGE